MVKDGVKWVLSKERILGIILGEIGSCCFRGRMFLKDFQEMLGVEMCVLIKMYPNSGFSEITKLK